MLQSPFDMRFINNIIDAINTTYDLATSYKVYTAVMVQKSTANPSAAVLENTLGGTITWSRANLGIYEGTCTVPFTSDVTVWCSFTPSVQPCVVSGKVLNGKIELRSYDMAGNLADNLLIGSLEIRQY
jgi:hypothetical protein